MPTVILPEKLLDISRYEKWSAAQLTEYLKAKEVPVGDNLITHKITGALVDDLTEDLCESLGYESLGDRILVWKALIELQNTPKKHGSLKDYLQDRWEKSNLRKLYEGEDLGLDEADSAVNSFALVNALILTVPFSVLMGLSTDYFNAFYDDMNTYIKLDSRCASVSYAGLRIYMLRLLFATAYSSMITVIICIFYYILRPKFNFFHQWWGRSKYCLMMMFGLCPSSLCCLCLVLYL
jgi:hypothetical protein